MLQQIGLCIHQPCAGRTEVKVEEIEQRFISSLSSPSSYCLRTTTAQASTREDCQKGLLNDYGVPKREKQRELSTMLGNSWLKNTKRQRSDQKLVIGTQKGITEAIRSSFQPRATQQFCILHRSNHTKSSQLGTTQAKHYKHYKSNITRGNCHLLYLQIYPKNPGITILQYYYEKKPQCLEIQKVRLMLKNRVEALLLQMYISISAQKLCSPYFGCQWTD